MYRDEFNDYDIPPRSQSIDLGTVERRELQNPELLSPVVVPLVIPRGRLRSRYRYPEPYQFLRSPRWNIEQPPPGIHTQPEATANIAQSVAGEGGRHSEDGTEATDRARSHSDNVEIADDRTSDDGLSVEAYRGVASSVAALSTFAGGLTYNNALSLQTRCPPCGQEYYTWMSDALDIGFLAFAVCLFSMLWVIVLLRPFDAKDVLKPKGHHAVLMLILFYIAIICFEVGFTILLYILVALGNGNKGWVIGGGVLIAVGGLTSIGVGTSKPET